jgi:hypothetical protein
VNGVLSIQLFLFSVLGGSANREMGSQGEAMSMTHVTG